ncbi:MAG TPA: DUF2630 family protein [Ktedonobacterales bacterium]|nr:DUF2630 family protein [Ktedonobacterales bacterium]
MDDRDILSEINRLTDEEHHVLHTAETGEGLDEAGKTRLSELKVEIDRLWDLLRQRRARRHNGLDPDGAKERDAAVVEHYQQ